MWREAGGKRISGLYAARRPGLLSEWIPLRDRIDSVGRPSLWEWVIIAVTLIVYIPLGLAIYGLTMLISRHVGWRASQLLRAAALPLATLMAALSFQRWLHEFEQLG